MTGRRAGLALAAILALGPVLAPAALAAQETGGGTPDRAPDRGTFGLVAGRASSRQIWTQIMSTESVDGAILGAFVDVQTPVRILSIRAEVDWVRRGSLVWDADHDPERRALSRVRSTYLSFPIHAKVGGALGPLSAYLFGGPTLDQLMGTDTDANLRQLLGEEKPTVLSVSVGAGVGARIDDRLRVGVEARLTEGLTEAYWGNLASVRNRSLELLVRVGRPL